MENEDTDYYPHILTGVVALPTRLRSPFAGLIFAIMGDRQENPLAKMAKIR
jgi:hypothetical protein